MAQGKATSLALWGLVGKNPRQKESSGQINMASFFHLTLTPCAARSRNVLIGVWEPETHVLPDYTLERGKDLSKTSNLV